MQIGICGCGWLGQPLAKHLNKRGHNIVATRRLHADLSPLQALGYTALNYALGDPLDNASLQPLFSCEVLVLNIPPGRKTMAAEVFVKHMTALLAHASNSGIKHLIFISTTSVYGQQSAVVTEQTQVQPNTPSGSAHVFIEESLFEHFKQRGTVLRLAGLVDRNRHPAKSLSGKTALKNGGQGVNLIHQQDVIKAISKIIEENVWGETLHLAATDHPSREQYYVWAATKLGLPVPQFLAENPSASGKLIDGRWSLQKLGLSLDYASPFDMLD